MRESRMKFPHSPVSGQEHLKAAGVVNCREPFSRLTRAKKF